MRQRIINFLKNHPIFVRLCWNMARTFLYIWGFFVPIQKKTMIFCSFGGRKFDDSPKAIYEEVCSRKEFDDWNLIWVFTEPEKFELHRGKKVKIDTIRFFHALLYSKVWVSNSGMDRGIDLHRKKNVIVETWHGTPLKKIGGDENQNSLGGGMVAPKGKPDNKTIRCAQSEFDRDIFARIFNADKDAILLCDLPRNDALFRYSLEEIERIKNKLNIGIEKKVILYTPTYREYLIDENRNTFLAPPMDLMKWERELGDEYVLLIRAHYAVSNALNITESSFVKDVSDYPCLNDLYIISDMMISDYSSTYFDYSILNRPMFCFAYDLEEYEKKRGLYLNIKEELPCEIDRTEESLISNIKNVKLEKAISRTKEFSQKYTPYAGGASAKVVDKILSQLYGER